MKVQNYGDWRGDRRGGHHPPACTCYKCNEERNKQTAVDVAAEVEEHVKRGEPATAPDNRQPARPAQPESRSSGQSLERSTNRPGSEPQRRPQSAPRKGNSSARRKGPRRSPIRPKFMLLLVFLLCIVAGVVAAILYANSSSVLVLPQDEHYVVAVIPLQGPNEELARTPAQGI